MEVGQSDQRRDAYRTHLYNTILVKRTRIRVRNTETRMWSLVAKRDIEKGTFIGFYTGSMASRTCPPDSHYSLHVGRSQPCIVPFINEDHITSAERDIHPLASMNEPSEGEFANCHMAVQDFNASEVADVKTIHNSEFARYFRGMACFSCHDINAGDALTWNYGPSYEPIRQLMGYVAGQPCRRVLDNEVFIKADSRSVLESLGGRVPNYVVFPVLKNQTIKSARFKTTRRRHTVDSEGEESASFTSGSDQEVEYRPVPTKRRQAGPSL